MIAASALITAVLAALAPSSAQPARTQMEDPLNQAIRPYSSQRIVLVDVGETVTVTLRNDKKHTLKLVSVKEHRDGVVEMVRWAEVALELDGKKVDLVCKPYTMPTLVGGVRILADTTKGWGAIDKDAQFSVWDAAAPVVDTKRFGMALRSFRLFGEGTQCYDEPVHLGAGDGDPDGQRFYHDYGFDLAGYEGKDEVVSPVAGTVIRFWPSREDLCSVLVQDAGGVVWELAHLKSAEPEIQVGTKVKKGQKIGLLGRTGPSGNFSHTHLGTYLSLDDLNADRMNRRLNLYPWYVAVYQALHPTGILAVARPHETVFTGEDVALDGGNSLAWGGRKIVSYRWELPDGKVVESRKATFKPTKPGTYSAALWVRDDRGREDVDFCTVKAYTKGAPEKGMPHVFVTAWPSEGVKPGKDVWVRFWLQGAGDPDIEVSFDGVSAGKFKSYAEIKHAFAKPGIHVVSARCEVDGKSVTQRMKVVVDEK